VTNQTTKQMDHEISNGFGFGGVNASALFRRWTGKLADASAGGSHD
jgi:3-oxoacyl-[acyl-carrier-protein] synthase II